jgi:hypothetical protein
MTTSFVRRAGRRRRMVTAHRANDELKSGLDTPAE